jgi:hypothetical protein
MSVKFSNNATTELASSIGTSDTSITVVDASKFPILTAGDYTYVTLDTDTASPTREIVRVTAISGNVLTVIRGQDGTSPASFAAGTKVELRLTAALLNDVAGANPSGEPIGFPDKSQTTITFDSGIRTFSITPTGASFDVYCKGVKYTYTTVQLVTIPNTTGLHFIYFNASGVLSTQMSYFTWEEHAPTAYVYWNATTQQAIYFGDERHGITLDWQTHEYLHRTRGAAIANGFAASGYTTTGTGATNADAQIDIAGGTFFDEDMQVDIVSTNSPVAGTWQQDLSGPARIPVMYLSGAAWVIDSPTDFPFKVVSSVPQYNLLSGSTWSTASVANNSYFVSWILATNNLTYPVISIISQAPTNQLSVAEAMTFEGLNLNGFPSVEFRPLHKVIYQYKDGFANSVKSSTIAVYDLRSISSAGVAAALVQDHGNLSGLTDDDHPQYVHTSEVRTPSAAVKNSFFPSQVGQTGKYLSTDGTNTVWEPAPSGSLSFTGDVTGTGSTGSSVAMTLAASGVVAGQYTKVTVDSKGRVTAGTGVTSSDVTTALGYTPYNATNPAGYTTNVGTVYSVSGTGTVSGLTLTGSVTSSGSLTLGGTLSLTSGQVTTALGFTPYNATNPSGYITGITSGMVTSALGYTPYNSSNPSGYITSSSNITGTAAGITGYTIDSDNGTPTTLMSRNASGDSSVGSRFHFKTATAFDGASALIGLNWGGSAGTYRNFVVYDYPNGRVVFRAYGETRNFEVFGALSAAGGLSVSGTAYYTFNKPSPSGYQTTALFGTTGGGLFITSDNAIISKGAYYNNGWIATATSGSAIDFSTATPQIFYFSGATVGAAPSLSANYNILHAGNYGDYAPSKTGTGASGTWGINITGGAGRLSALGSYVLNASTNGRDFNDGIQAGFVDSGTNGYPQYGSIVRIKTYPNDGGAAELYFPYGASYGGSAMRYRLGQYDNAGWTSWKTVLDDSNYSSYALPLSGGTLTGAIYVGTTGSASATRALRVGPSGGSPASFGSYAGSWRSTIEIWDNAATRMLHLTPPDGTNYNWSSIKSVGAGLRIDVGGSGGTNAIDIGTNGVANFPQGLQQGGNQVLHAGNYTGFNGTLRALGGADGMDFNTSNYNSMYFAEINGSANKPTSYSYNYGTILTFDPGLGTGGRAQFYVSHVGNDLTFRGGWGGNSSWGTWNRVLTNQNYGGYALPLSGGNLTGQTTLTAGHTDTRFQLRYVHGGDVNSGGAGYLTMWASEPGLTYAYTGIGGNVNIGGQHYGRQSTGQTYGVYIRWDTASGQTQFWNTTGTPGVAGGEGTLRAYVASDGEFYATANTHKVLHLGNYSSHALPLSGGTLTGTTTLSSGQFNLSAASQSINTTTPGTGAYQLNFTGQATPDYAHAITWGWASSGAQAGIYVQSSGSYGTKMYLATTDSFATGSKTALTIDHSGIITTNRNYLQATGSLRAPIFYDSDDTARYFNGTGGINFLTGSSNRVTIYSSDEGLLVNNAEGCGVVVRVGSAYGLPGIYVNPNLYLSSESNVIFRIANGERGYMDASSNLFAYGSMRSPIFYDQNNTGYYVDPASTSLLSTVLIAGTIRNNGSVSDDDNFGFYFDSAASTAYAIYRESGGWSGTYPDLRIAFHTGIKLGANSSYNGIRFYDDYTMVNQVMSVNNGSDPLGNGNVYVNSALQAGGSLRAPIFYDSNDTGYYLDGASTSRLNYVVPNRIKCVNNVDNTPRWDFSAYVVEAQHWYGNNSSMTMYLGESNYINIRNTADVHGDTRSPIYYDRNNTGYYIDPAANTAIRTVGSWRADSADWDGEFSGKIQYHSSYWYLQSYNGWFLRNSGGTNVVSVDSSGNLTANGNVTAYSDRRLKDNVRDLTGAKAYLNKISAKRFTWKDDGYEDIGFIAQDVEAAGLTEFVLETADYDPNTETMRP